MLLKDMFKTQGLSVLDIYNVTIFSQIKLVLAQSHYSQLAENRS